MWSSILLIMHYLRVWRVNCSLVINRFCTIFNEKVSIQNADYIQFCKLIYVIVIKSKNGRTYDEDNY